MEWMWANSDLANALAADWSSSPSKEEDFDQLLQLLEDDSASTNAVVAVMEDSMVATSPPSSQSQADVPVGLPMVTAVGDEQPPPPPSSKRRRKISGSTRVRTELLQLRSKAKELEDQIALMQQRFAIRRRAKQDTAAAATVDNTGQSKSIWKSVAQRQLRTLKEAQEVNDKLRTALEDERKAMQTFIRSMNRSSTLPSAQAEADTPLTHLRRLGKITDFDEGVDAHQCEVLLRQLDTMVESIDDAFTHACFHSNAITSRMSLPHEDGAVSVLDCRVLPFDDTTIGSRVWDYYAARDTEPASLPHMAVNDNLMIKGFKMEQGIPALQIASCAGLIVGRRIIEPNRCVMAWTAAITPSVMVGNLFPPLEMATLYASGWDVVEQVHEGVGPMAKVSMHHIVRLGRPPFRPRSIRSMVSDVLRRLLVKGISEHQDGVHRCLDDSLIHGQHAMTVERQENDDGKDHYLLP